MILPFMAVDILDDIHDAADPVAQFIKAPPVRDRDAAPPLEPRHIPLGFVRGGPVE